LSDLDKGGLTPSIEKVKDAKAMTNIPIRVMLREIPNTYVYSEEIMNKHVNDLLAFKTIGVEGIAFGALTEEGRLDIPAMELIGEHKGDLGFTLNKAFDEIAIDKDDNERSDSYKKDIEALFSSKKANVDTIMSACSDKHANDVSHFEGASIMPAAGITIETAVEKSKEFKAL
ncbi:MAG: copper homeostasis protein CutC, partial [Pikeienuella sp.]